MQPTQWKYFDTLVRQDIAAILETWREHQHQAGTGVFALVCEQEREAVALLQQVAAALSMPLMGAVVPGLVAEARFWRRGILLVAFDAATPRRIVPLPHVENRTTDSAVESLADFVATHADENGDDTLLLLVDAMIPDLTSLLDRLYLEIGDQVNYAGTCVGSETFQSVPCLFDNEVLVEGAAFALLLRQHPGATLAHHYRGDEALWVATATTGSHVDAIDGKPAFEVYRELMASEYGIDLDRENFYRYAVHFPFALNRAQGESLVRIPVKVEPDGSVYCSGEVPENALLSVVRAVAPGSLKTAHEVGEGVRSRAASGVLAFYCAGRLMHLDEDAATAELSALVRELAPAPLFGALCLGEIGSGRRQYPAFHNATIMALPWN
ncbi:MAG: FIST C-terminal domain-containing protein [Candidatus Competibacter sp.]|nr:FIST C-terminal domain-containing protein [Candidatus Competibacter sp.]MDG4606526.1 FIST C-terminal domain-containing protein [Candidatus Contendobacter sp.]HRD50583.1 FIST C-terminal domain-containing protein [Candidatus Contendobacter sp.]